MNCKSGFWNFRKIVHKFRFVTDIRHKKSDFWNQIFENSHEYGNFENTIFTLLFKFLAPEADGYQVQKKFVNDFWKLLKPFSIWGTYNVPEGSSANPYGETRSAEFDGTDRWDGWDGWDGPEMFPLKFFILCGYLY